MNIVSVQKRQGDDDFKESYDKKLKKEKIFEKFYVLFLSVLISFISISLGAYSWIMTESLGKLDYSIMLVFLILTPSWIIDLIFGEGNSRGNSREGFGRSPCIVLGFIVMFVFSRLLFWSYISNITSVLIISLVLIIAGVTLVYWSFDDGPTYGWHP